ncbi:MAG TPA: hypothetical protein VFE98_03455 [Candidatus Bathyarchaeia archaeon]|nr:hypothetical protein [Candidatus Bathyarchaeia archaeon]
MNHHRGIVRPHTDYRRENGNSRPDSMRKFGIALGEESFGLIAKEAARRGVSVQALIRAVIVPDWVKVNLGPSPIAASDTR